MNGLSCKFEIISEETEKALLKQIDENAWDDTMKRRVQQYGHRYNYVRLGKNASDVMECPPWARELLEACRSAGLEIPEFPEENLQIIVNEYFPGQGISAHIDDPVKFSDWVLTISLGSGCTMTFREKNGSGEENVYLNRRSAYLMQGDVRYKWTHEIKSRKSDVVNGEKRLRDRRVSVTFRVVMKKF